MCRFLPLIFLPVSYPFGSMQAPFFRAFHALAVDHAGGGTGFAPQLLPTLHIKRVMDASQGAVPFPEIKIAMQGALGWKVLRSVTPLTPGAQYIHDAIQHIPLIDFPFASAVFGGRDVLNGIMYVLSTGC